jgi:hypothetical protein
MSDMVGSLSAGYTQMSEMQTRSQYQVGVVDQSLDLARTQGAEMVNLIQSSGAIDEAGSMTAGMLGPGMGENIDIMA